MLLWQLLKLWKNQRSIVLAMNQPSGKSYPKNISAVKKGETKKVQVTERPKDVISL